MLGQVVGTLVGVAVGGALTFFATYANERAKWSRSHAVRWDERRLAAYVEYSNCITRMHALARRIAASRNLSADVEPLAVDQGLPLLIEAEAERSLRWQEVLLLGGSRATDIGQQLNQCTWVLEWFARGELTDRADWELARAEAHRLRRAFVFEARRDMGVSPSDSAALTQATNWTPESILGPLRARPIP
ncbi:hypothetical protein [Nocardia wallacei]|uniref:hypothetical protein n=1 Tax=Nocardia wallacei TaxID=480035 RepID=UPI002458A942|nr:hypothetical protein [Nocardia wallacei]